MVKMRGMVGLKCETTGFRTGYRSRQETAACAEMEHKLCPEALKLLASGKVALRDGLAVFD
jgi:hypothetical protein